MRTLSKLALALFSLIVLNSCGGGPGTTPDSVAVVKGCYYGYGDTTCSTVFDDGQPGYTVQTRFGQTYICKGQGL